MKNKHYKLVLEPKWVRTSEVEYTEETCPECNGRGIVNSYRYVSECETCDLCWGRGVTRDEVEIPDPPKIDNCLFDAAKILVDLYGRGN